MTISLNSLRLLLKGGIALVDPDSGAVAAMIALQFNPETLSRTLQVQGISEEGGDRSEPLCLKGLPIETIKVEAEIDASDQLKLADATAAKAGIHPQLAALEALVYPPSDLVQSNNMLAQARSPEVTPDTGAAAISVQVERAAYRRLHR